MTTPTYLQPLMKESPSASLRAAIDVLRRSLRVTLQERDVSLADKLLRKRSGTTRMLSQSKARCARSSRHASVTPGQLLVMSPVWPTRSRVLARKRYRLRHSLSGSERSSSSLLLSLGPVQGAGIPRVGPTLEKRTFHSFRHTFAKRALESGAQITWLSRHLGHSTLKVTTDGHWERAERKLQAAKMEGAFPV